MESLSRIIRSCPSLAAHICIEHQPKLFEPWLSSLWFLLQDPCWMTGLLEQPMASGLEACIKVGEMDAKQMQIVELHPPRQQAQSSRPANCLWQTSSALRGGRNASWLANLELLVSVIVVQDMVILLKDHWRQAADDMNKAELPPERPSVEPALTILLDVFPNHRFPALMQ